MGCCRCFEGCSSIRDGGKGIIGCGGSGNDDIASGYGKDGSQVFVDLFKELIAGLGFASVGSATAARRTVSVCLEIRGKITYLSLSLIDSKIYRIN